MSKFCIFKDWIFKLLFIDLLTFGIFAVFHQNKPLCVTIIVRLFNLDLFVAKSLQFL